MRFRRILIMAIGISAAYLILPGSAPTVEEEMTELSGPFKYLFFVTQREPLSDKDKFNRVARASAEDKDRLLNELMEELSRVPGRALETWEAYLLLTNGEKVFVRYRYGDGAMVDSEKFTRSLIKALENGQVSSAQEYLRINEITPFRYWAGGAHTG